MNKFLLTFFLISTSVLCFVSRSMNIVDDGLNNKNIWSDSTNGVRMGVLPVEVFQGSLWNAEKPLGILEDWVLIPVVKAAASNEVLVWFPPATMCCEIEMFNQKSESVAKTHLGSRFGEQIKWSRNGLVASVGFIPYRTDPHDVEHPFMFGRGLRLSDIFVIKKPGDYVVRISWRVVVITEKGEKIITRFAPVDVHLSIRER